MIDTKAEQQQAQTAGEAMLADRPNEAGKKQIASSVKVAATACHDRRSRLPVA